MDIQKELESFKTVAIAKAWNVDGETTQTNYRFYCLTTQSGWEMWQAAKAQAVPEGFVSKLKTTMKNHYDRLNDVLHEDGYNDKIFGQLMGLDFVEEVIDEMIEAREQKA